MIEPRRENDLIHFFIENLQDPKPEGLWKANTRISIGSTETDAKAVIETIMILGNKLKICARLSRDHYDFEFKDSIHIVSQREMPEGKGLREGFLESIPPFSNGKRIIKALYGGSHIYYHPLRRINSYIFPGPVPITLNPYQNEYVERLLSETPLTMANSPFGCGKSMTIATAAFYAVLRSRSRQDKSQQLLVTQSNFASVNLVDITKKYREKCRVIRYISDNNWMELPEDGRSIMDLPFRMQQVFMDYVSGVTPYGNDYHIYQMAIFLKEKNAMKIEDMNPKCQNFFRINPNAKKYEFFKLVRIFFDLYDAEIVITTSDSLLSALPHLRGISTVQFDEASQIPECALIQILSMFPDACFGLVGDINQLPPYCDVLLTGYLKTFGIGNTMERAIMNNMFPQVDLRIVYRCHPVTTLILGHCFYGGKLFSGVSADERNELMVNRPDFWPNPNFPIMIVNNTAPSRMAGTSCFNEKELFIVKQLVYALTSPTYNYTFKPSDIGIISFYRAQTSFLLEEFRDLNVKCGTVDSFQGTEKEIIIVCCTNEAVNGFLGMRNRINVAMSRAKQTTIVVGNLNGLLQSIHWRTIAEMVKNQGCVKTIS
uniref:AAA_12 domain-containing protein n=1 Tax=Caenorhabditis tropicalis TaxID=1561998 RepID=A0A1I7TDC6_9PELO